MDKHGSLDPKRMFEHACAFCDCATFCEVESSDIEYRMRSHTVSGIVNSAFACEVFIKTLLVIHGKTLSKEDKHNLQELWKRFKKLDDTTAVFIEERMRKWFNSDNEDLFDELLREASNAFVHWRYIYEMEDGDLNLNFLRGFRLFLRDECCRQLFGIYWKMYKNR